MDYLEFKKQFSRYPFVESREVLRRSPNVQVAKNQLSRWSGEGLLIKLRRGLYIFNEEERKVEIDQNVVASRLYEPSYLSLEYALNFYGLIPERVIDVTSVTTRKTMQFRNDFGSFIYRHIKPEAFRGFKKFGDKNLVFFMAEPEKAVIDFLYLNLNVFNDNIADKILIDYRFQNLDILHKERLLELGKLFQNKKLMKIIKEVIKIIEEE